MAPVGGIHAPLRWSEVDDPGSPMRSQHPTQALAPTHSSVESSSPMSAAVLCTIIVPML